MQARRRARSAPGLALLLALASCGAVRSNDVQPAPDGGAAGARVDGSRPPPPATGVVLRSGGLTTIGVGARPSGPIRISNQRLTAGSARVCKGQVCVSGGINP